jgi:predicted metal-dependent hydrolase
MIRSQIATLPLLYLNTGEYLFAISIYAKRVTQASQAQYFGATRVNRKMNDWKQSRTRTPQILCRIKFPICQSVEHFLSWKIRARSHWIFLNFVPPSPHCSADVFTDWHQTLRCACASHFRPTSGILFSFRPHVELIVRALLTLLIALPSLEEWYRAHALEKLKEKTKRYAFIIGVSPKSVDLKDYKARWGSCSSSGDVTYNWRIIIAPHHIVDYIVVHELCHSLEHNHGPKYWKHVERVVPNYKDCREWLKVNGEALDI